MKKETVKECRSGSMAPNTKGPGRATKQMAKVSSYMPVETSMMECGITIRHMDKVLTTIPTVPFTSEIGSKIRSMVKA